MLLPVELAGARSSRPEPDLLWRSRLYHFVASCRAGPSRWVKCPPVDACSTHRVPRLPPPGLATPLADRSDHWTGRPSSDCVVLRLGRLSNEATYRAVPRARGISPRCLTSGPAGSG